MDINIQDDIPCYYFSFSGRRCHGFATIVSPDGTKAAFAWTPPNLPAPNWRIRMVDMATGDVRDLVPPEWETDAENTVLFSYWIDNNTLSVTESDGLTAEATCISWTCTL